MHGIAEAFGLAGQQACGGDVRAAVRAMIVAKGLLEAELNEGLRDAVEGIFAWAN